MLAMIPIDFDVIPVFQDGVESLFVARRSDVWHFVLATTKAVAPNNQNIDIGQFHLPRFSVARALSPAGDGSAPQLIEQLGIGVSGDSFHITLRGKKYPLSEKLLSDMQKDLLILERARAKVRAANAGFEVSGAVTSRGFPVVPEQRSLAEAIAFERETRNVLEPRNFGVYSAFCTWRDFLCEDPLKKKDIAAGIAQEMVSWNPETIGDDAYWESVFAIQERMWGERIWGPDVEVEEDVVFDRFLRTFERLSSIEFAQFVLMNSMHQGGPFHALATIFWLIDFDGYTYWRTREFQPDSPQEQEIRTHTAFIQLLGLTD